MAMFDLEAAARRAKTREGDGNRGSSCKARLSRKSFLIRICALLEKTIAFPSMLENWLLMPTQECIELETSVAHTHTHEQNTCNFAVACFLALL